MVQLYVTYRSIHKRKGKKVLTMGMAVEGPDVITVLAKYNSNKIQHPIKNGEYRIVSFRIIPYSVTRNNSKFGHHRWPKKIRRGA